MTCNGERFLCVFMFFVFCFFVCFVLFFFVFHFFDPPKVEARDELRINYYHKKNLILIQKNWHQFLTQHKAYKMQLQFIWYYLGFNRDISLHPLKYGYCIDDKELLISNICALDVPKNFLLSCFCPKYTKQEYHGVVIVNVTGFRAKIFLVKSN